MRLDRRLRTKSAVQVLAMRRAGRLVGSTLRVLAAAVAPGLRTADLDRIAEDYIRAHGGVPSFLGYHGFPASICTSVNEQVVHGIPGDRVLVDGDLISIDCGAIVDGWHGDAAVTVPVGTVGSADAALTAACEASMWSGIAAATLDHRLSDIGHAIERSVAFTDGGYGLVEDYTGHGIGTAMHEDPDVPNWGAPGRGPKLADGVVLAIEPMLTAGRADVADLDDGWTVVTVDGSRAAHWEHTVAITRRGPWVLTAPDGGAAALAARGLGCGALPD